MLMKESVPVQKGLGERVVMKTVLKAAIWPSITQIAASLYKVVFMVEMQQSVTLAKQKSLQVSSNTGCS